MADTRIKSTKSYDFHYVPDEGVLRGTIFEQQTEDAINDLGARTYEASDTATEALTEATTANKTANEALAIGNAAKTAADNAQQTAENARAAADTAQNTADDALTLAQQIKNSVSINGTDITSLIERVTANEGNIENIISVNSEQTADITALQNKVEVNMQNIFDNTSRIQNVTNFQDVEVEDANDLEEYGNYDASGISNLPSDGDYYVFARPNQSGDSNEILQIALDKATGAMYVRIGVKDDTEEGESDDTAWGEWKTLSFAAMTEEEVDTAWQEIIDEYGSTGAGLAPMTKEEVDMAWEGT